MNLLIKIILLCFGLYLPAIGFSQTHSKNQYDRYKGSITTTTIDNNTYVLSDGAIIGFEKGMENLMPLFVNGTLYRKLFYCAEDPKCEPSLTIAINAETGDTLKSPFDKKIGQGIDVSSMRVLKNSTLGPTRKVLWLYLDFFHEHGSRVYTIELENKNATKSTSLTDFFKKAVLTSIVYGGRIV